MKLLNVLGKWALFAFTAVSLAHAQNPTNPKAMITPPMSDYATINGLKMYYEIYGEGKPIVILHGGISASEMFGPNLVKLAEKRKVIAVHLQGHGKTADRDQPLRFEQMADDVATLIAQLGLGKADLLGYSLGGGVAWQAAIRHPDVIDRLIVVSAAITHSALYPEVAQAFEHMEANAPTIGGYVAASPLAQLYPHKDWVSLFTKMGELNKRDYDWTKEVAKIAAPTMIVFADADCIRPEHIVEIYKTLGGGQRDAGQA